MSNAWPARLAITVKRLYPALVRVRFALALVYMASGADVPPVALTPHVGPGSIARLAVAAVTVSGASLVRLNFAGAAASPSVEGLGGSRPARLKALRGVESSAGTGGTRRATARAILPAEVGPPVLQLRSS
jgi:hypothetical protein